LALNYTKGKGYFEQYKEDQEFTDYGLPNIEIGTETITETDLIRRRWLDNDFYVLNANANYKNKAWDVIFGTSLSTYSGDHYGEIIWAQYASNMMIRDRYYNGNGKKQDFSGFAKASYRMNEHVSLYLDLQSRYVSYKTTGTNSDVAPFIVDKHYNFFNPKAGITYTLNENNNMYFSYARANREPNRDDFENNPDIQPEQLNDFELGWRHHSEAFTFKSNLYYMLYNEQLVLTGAINDVGNPIRNNSGKSYRLGLEMEAVINVSNKFNIQPNVAISTNKNEETIVSFDGELVNLGTTNISFSPNIVAGNAFIYSPIKGLQMSLLSKFVGEQYMGNTDSEASKLDSYFVNDFNVMYQIETNSIFKAIVFSGLVNNLFGETYSSNGFYYTYDDDWSDPNQITTIEGTGYYPQATINFLLGVTLKF
jgi:iron complex outermembrane receptor protein